MVKLTTVQAAHTYGVLDPHIIERRDTKFLEGALSDGANIVPLPAGGWTDRGGSTDFGRARRRLTSVAFTGTHLSLPNGGSESTFLAGDDVTIAGATGSAFVLALFDFGTPTNLLFIDVLSIGIETTPADAALACQWWNGATWQPFGAAAKITLDRHTRRFASGAPGHAGHTATQFRIVLDATTAAGDVTIAGARLWAETATLSDGVIRRYAPEAGTAHQLVVTDRNVDVYENGTWRAAVPLPAGWAILRQLKFEPRYDTILVWQTTMRPQAILRLGSATEWACDDVAFTNIPLVDYGAVYANGVTAVQEIALYDVSATEKFELTVEGKTTAAIEVDANAATTEANIAAALEALPNVEPGLTVAVSGNLATVTFSGTGNADRPWLTMTGTALDADGYVRVRTVTEGKRSGEPLISDARGWPAVGRFAQQRLVMAGLKSRPNEVLASVTGQPFDLNTELDLAIAALSYEIDGSDNTAVSDIFVSRTLLFFGDKQIAYLKTRLLSADERPEFGLSDAPGIKPSVAPVSSDNALYYVQESGSSLLAMSWTEVESQYVADSASVLSAHLIRQPVDMARRRALGSVDSDLLMMVNGDGTLTALTLMRREEVSGFAPWTTDGAFRSVTVDADNRTWWLAERLDDGVTTLRLERHDPDLLLDEAIEISTPGGSNTTSGLARFNGRAVWAVADRSVHGPFTVAGGAIALPDGRTAEDWRIGTWPTPLATDTGVSLEMETRQRQARLARINRAEISVLDTTSIAIQANGGPVFDLPLRRAGDFITDTPPLDRPYSGKVEADGMHGFAPDAKLTVTQTWPGKITVRSVTKQVAA